MDKSPAKSSNSKAKTKNDLSNPQTINDLLIKFQMKSLTRAGTKKEHDFFEEIKEKDLNEEKDDINESDNSTLEDLDLS